LPCREAAKTHVRNISTTRHKFLNCRINRKLAFSPFWDLWGTSDKKTKLFLVLMSL